MQMLQQVLPYALAKAEVTTSGWCSELFLALQQKM